MTAVFNDDLLRALGAWQKGWRENQELRAELATELKRCCRDLPGAFKCVDIPCYRKRFLTAQDLVMLFLNEHLDDGITSWTVDRRYAEEFKGYTRMHDNSGAVFAGVPSQDECIVSLPALWAYREFQFAVDVYAQRGGENSEALLNFRDKQGEVVLSTQLRLDELVRLTGVSSTFDDLVRRAGLPEAAADDAWRLLVERGNIAGAARFIRDEAVTRAVTVIRCWLVNRLKSVGVDP